MMPDENNKGWAVVLRSGGQIKGGYDSRTTFTKYVRKRNQYLTYRRSLFKRVEAGETTLDAPHVVRTRWIILTTLIEMRQIVYLMRNSRKGIKK